MTRTQLRRLRDYLDRLQRGETFTPEEATDLRDLSDRIARDHPGEDWVPDVIKPAYTPSTPDPHPTRPLHLDSLGPWM